MHERAPAGAAHDISRRAFFAAAGAGFVAGAAACRMLRREAPAPRSAPLVYDDRGGLFIDALVNGGEPVRFILDTGASTSALSSAYATKLGLELRVGGEVEGSAGRVKVETASIDVEVPGGVGVVRIEPTVYPLASYDPRCVGILGYEVLSREPFQLRYAERRIVWNAVPPEDSLRMTLDHRIPRIAVLVNGKPLEVRIDTGAALAPSEDAYVNLTTEQASSVGLAGEPWKVWKATGSGGEISLAVYRLHSLRIGSRDVARPFAIVQPKVGYFARPEAVGFLGNNVLDKLDPFLDYRAGLFGMGR
jgi:predicted aspartyl protease